MTEKTYEAKKREKGTRSKTERKQIRRPDYLFDFLSFLFFPISTPSAFFSAASLAFARSSSVITGAAGAGSGSRGPRRRLLSGPPRSPPPSSPSRPRLTNGVRTLSTRRLTT